MRALTRTLVQLGLAAASSPGLAAQWGVSAEIGVARFGGTARDTSGTTVGPYRPTTFACRLDRQFGAVRGGISLLYAHPGLAGQQRDLAVVFYDGTSLVEVGPEVSIGFARFATGAVVRVEGGPVLDLWDVDGETSRTRVGAHAGLALEWPLSSRFTGTVRARGALTGSMMNADEQSTNFERHATRRFGVSLGLRYRT